MNFLEPNLLNIFVSEYLHTMTEKQANILRAALELFAQEGFKSTSTSKVAKRAGVSEGLIFRHFGNKDGLLQAIIRQGEERAKLLFADIVLETDPKEVIRKTLEMGQKTSLVREEADFWKLQFKIKWELEQYGAYKMEPLLNALVNAFTKLGYDEPELEANFLTVFLDGLATRFYLDKAFDMVSVLNFAKSKYGV